MATLSVQSQIGKGEIVHEWLEPHGGAENVLESITSFLPYSRVTCLWNDAPHRFAHRVEETWLARTPLRKHKQLALPFALPTWRHLPDSSADWILCATHLFAHHARFGGAAREANKLLYVYTPARALWAPESDARASGVAASLASPVLRAIDRRRAQEASSITAISGFVQNRIAQAWDRDSRIIYPPVDVRGITRDSIDNATLAPNEYESLVGLPDTFILGASRFVAYKRLDSVISAGEAVHLPVVLAGDGPELAHLRALATVAKVPVHIIRRPSSLVLHELFRRALVYVFLALEDFGIMPVESMALGTPVVGINQGGVTETVISGKTGVLIDSITSGGLKQAVERASLLSSASCVERAWQFDTEVFQKQFDAWVRSEANAT